MESESRKGVGLDLAWTVWRRRKRLATAAFALPLVGGGAFVFSLPSRYEAKATILIDRSEVPEDVVRPAAGGAVETRVQAITQELLSRDQLDALIRRFDVYPELRGRIHTEELVERMRRDVVVNLRGIEARRGGPVAFTIGFQAAEPATAADVTNTLAAFYVSKNATTRERQATGTSKFLRAQLEETKSRLDEQDRRLTDFKRRFAGELPQELNANVAALERLNAQLRLNSDSQARGMERRTALTGQLAETVGVTRPGADADVGAAPAPGGPLAARLARLREELTELRTRFSEKYPDVIRLKAEIAAVESQLATSDASARRPAPPAAPPPVDPRPGRLKETLAEVDADLKMLVAEQQRLRSEIATYQRRIEGTPVRDHEYRRLAGDYELTREMYASLLKRHAEAQIAESLEQRHQGERFRILEAAVPPQRPIGPKRLQLLLVVVGVSIGAAVGAAVIGERLDTSFHSLAGLRTFTSVAVAGGIPRDVADADLRRARRRTPLAVAAAVVALAAVAGTGYWLAANTEQLVRLLGLGAL